LLQFLARKEDFLVLHLCSHILIKLSKEKKATTQSQQREALHINSDAKHDDALEKQKLLNLTIIRWSKKQTL